MLDAWIIEQLKKKQEEEDKKKKNENVLRLPIPEENPCKQDEEQVEYPFKIEFDL